MPFASFFLELALFLSLLTLLASLPNDPYFHPWHDGPPTYRIAHDAHGHHALATAQGPPYAAPPQDWWYRLQRRGEGPPADRRDFPPRPQWDLPSPHRRRSDALPGDDRQGTPNIGSPYSSHVNFEAANQNNEATEKTPKNFRENMEPIFGSSIPGKVDERINFEEGWRDAGAGKGLDIPNPRIVTPKGGRRPPQPQGSSAKNQNKPFNPGAPTTEKAFRNQTSKGSKKPRPSNPKPQGGDIVFPDGYPKKFVPRIAKCAKTSTFCEHLGDEYPSDYINQVLKKDGAMFREFFGRDVISDPNITERINVPEENSLCPYRQEVVFPRAAQNKEDKWLFIVNQDQYVQGVTVEVCLNPESRCILTEGFPLGYTPYCKQKYIERRLVAIGEDGKPHSDSFRLPSCCSCVVKHETSARLGLPRSSGDAGDAEARDMGHAGHEGHVGAAAPGL